MSWINLGNPTPRERYESYAPYCWPVNEIEYLDCPTDLELPSFDQVVGARKTRREFGQLERNALAKFLWLSCRTIAVGHDHYGYPLTRRPVPSGGAIHPIHLLVVGKGQDWLKYESDHHGLVPLVIESEVRSGLWSAIEQVLDPGNGSALLFVAEPGKTKAKYQYAESVIWRDAGVLIGHMALVAEALELNFCPLGITGEPWVSSLDSKGKLVGVGLVLLGARVGSR